LNLLLIIEIPLNMDYSEFSKDLLTLYQKMSEAFSGFQKKIDLPCLSGCGQCCLNPEVEASVYEMIPMAFEIIAENKFDEVLGQLNQGPTSCIIYQSHSPDGSKGQCGRYHSRPSLCREFGASGFTNKYGSPELSLCKLIKHQYPDKYKETVIDQEAPQMKEWTYQLMSLHPDLVKERYPINQALRYALEKILFWMTYQNKA
jgi:Fe-S-cluster containining protein